MADDKKIEAIYTIMEAEISDLLYAYPEELKAELQKRNTDYKNGTAKTVTAEESQARIQSILNRLK